MPWRWPEASPWLSTTVASWPWKCFIARCHAAGQRNCASHPQQRTLHVRGVRYSQFEQHLRAICGLTRATNALLSGGDGQSPGRSVAGWRTAMAACPGASPGTPALIRQSHRPSRSQDGSSATGEPAACGQPAVGRTDPGTSGAEDVVSRRGYGALAVAAVLGWCLFWGGCTSSKSDLPTTNPPG